MPNKNKKNTSQELEQEAYYWGDVLLALILAVVLLLNFLKILPQNISNTIFIILSIIGTIPVLYSALKSLLKKKVGIDLLASIALIFALLTHEWHSAVFITLMLASARVLTAITANRSKNALKSLLKLRPEKAFVKRNGKVIEVKIEKLKVGDLVIVETGQRIPVDGKIMQGKATINQSSLTGESAPVFKDQGHHAYSSTVVEEGSIVIRAEKVGAETSLEKIIDLVGQAQKQKPKSQNLGEIFASWYIFVILGASLLLYILTQRTELVLTILLVTCADDIAIAVPLAFTASIGAAGKNGIIVKGGSFFETASQLKTIVADKTGTLTIGKPKIEKIYIFNKMRRNDFLRYFAASSLMSKHPLSKAIVNFAREDRLKIPAPKKYRDFIGQGSTSIVNGKKITVGRLSFLESKGVKISKGILRKINREKATSHMISAMGIGDKIVGFITLEDEIKNEAAHFFKKLPDYGIERAIMLTGDNEFVAKYVAKKVGLKEYFANLLPDQKLEKIRSLLSRKKKLAMIGDGVNDAAALSLANIGIAMGAIGTDAAIESADVALMNDNLNKILKFLEISKRTMSVVKQDFLIWGTVNAIGLALAISGYFNPSSAAAFNFVTDFFPILNSMRLFRR